MTGLEAEPRTTPPSQSYAAYWLPAVTLLAFLLAWDVSVRLFGSQLFPKPLEVFGGDCFSPLATIRIPYRIGYASGAGVASFGARADFAVSSR